MKKILLLVLPCCLLATYSHSQQNNAPADTTSAIFLEAKAAIAKGNALWAEGWRKGDAGMVSSLFAADGVQLSLSGKIIAGPAQVADKQKKAMQGVDPGVKVTIVTQRIWVVGVTAYETGHYTYEYVQQGKAGKDYGRYVTIWRRQDNGEWKLVSDMGFPDE